MTKTEHDKFYLDFFTNHECRICGKHCDGRKSSKNPLHLEISRFATKKNTIVVGGFHRLLSYAVEWAKERGYEHILTYSDLAHGSGYVYARSGFSPVHMPNPSIPYWYTNGIERFSRQSFMPKDGLSERELAEQQNVWKLWGCGNNFFSLSLL